MDIFIPVAIVVSIGLIFGIILTIAAKFMAVPVNEVVERLREALPGANCGACGYAGCEDYATALGGDESSSLSTALCPVGGGELSVKLGEILGVEAGAAQARVAIVRCRGTHDKTSGNILKHGRSLSCREANTLYGGQQACAAGCLGLGDCARVCSYGAIFIRDGVAQIDRNRCIGCGLCTSVCPKELIIVESRDSRNYVSCSSHFTAAQTLKQCKTGCLGCKKCMKACPFNAVLIRENLAIINTDTCKNCGKCAKECPTGAIMSLPKGRCLGGKT